MIYLYGCLYSCFIVRFFFLSFCLIKVHLLKEKQEKARLEALADTEQAMELNHRHEREKQLLRDDNNKLASDVEFVSFVYFYFFIILQ